MSESPRRCEGQEGASTTGTRHVPFLPQPRHPAAAARALAGAAHEAARTWAQPLEPARHNRAVSQLYSTLRDLGIGSRGLASWQDSSPPAGPVSAEFARHVTAAARRFADAWQSLEGVLAYEGTGILPDPDEPGAALCHAARTAIPAWRQPSGTSADRDSTIRLFITATGFVSAATLGLATYAPRHRAAGLQSALASLVEATADLSAAIEQTAARPGCAPPARTPGMSPQPDQAILDDRQPPGSQS